MKTTAAKATHSPAHSPASPSGLFQPDHFLWVLGSLCAPTPRGASTGTAPTLALSSGMAVSAEIHQGKRTVMAYLLSPVLKVGAEAARER